LHFRYFYFLQVLFFYCKQDVKVTKELYEFGREKGYVQFRDKRSHRLRKVSVRW